MATNAQGVYPGGKRFAFSIVDDTDLGTVATLGPVYTFLRELGMRTTKTVWPRRSSMPDQCDVNSETLEVPEYVEFVRSLREAGFEIALHTSAPGSSRRDETIAAYDRFRELFGDDPTMNVNHSLNRENIYWGRHRFDNPLVRSVYDRMAGRPEFEGHVEGSPFFWGDVCRARTRYVRGFIVREIDTLRANPSMPYHDPRRPYVNFWYSASDGEDLRRFADLIADDAQGRLERDGGCCIVYTHLGKSFADDVRTNGEWGRRMRRLAQRDGWFAPASEILDFLRTRRATTAMPRSERRRLELRWLAERLAWRFKRAVRKRR
jgi:hypothetical protein